MTALKKAFALSMLAGIVGAIGWLAYNPSLHYGLQAQAPKLEVPLSVTSISCKQLVNHQLCFVEQSDADASVHWIPAPAGFSFSLKQLQGQWQVHSDIEYAKGFSEEAFHFIAEQATALLSP